MVSFSGEFEELSLGFVNFTAFGMCFIESSPMSYSP
jgi:hypothetical protein